MRLGFSACGIAEAAPVDAATADRYRQWIACGGHADMHYLESNTDKRLDPTLLLPGARSIIVVAMNYAPARRLPENEYQIADYALGLDYHDVMRSRLQQLAASAESLLNAALKICVDTVPILERYWAQRAGVGFIGRNHQLIIPGTGSMVFLGEIVTPAEADRYDAPIENRCGTCRRCLDACPTGALRSEEVKVKSEEFATATDSEQKTSVVNNSSRFTLHDALNSRLCLSYQTIENRGPLDPQAADKLGKTIYGCDRCQLVCPWNRFARPTDVAELQPSEALLSMTTDKWHTLTVEEYRRLFRGSAVKRAKYEGLMRNIEAVRHQEANKKTLQK